MLRGEGGIIILGVQYLFSQRSKEMVEEICAAFSALEAFEKKLEVTRHNVANMNTPGFKKGSALFQEAFPSRSRCL